MDEEKKDVTEAQEPGIEGNGGDQKFCLLCSKYTKNDMTPVTIGTINRIPLVVEVCPSCAVVISNAARIFRKSAVKAQDQLNRLVPGGGNRIIIPGMQIPKGILKKS